jgi:hypothetical protein
MPGIPWPVTVWYDPPKAQLQISLATDSKLTMHLSAVISGAKGTATVDGSMQSTMLDSGAEENFLSHEFAVRNHFIQGRLSQSENHPTRAGGAREAGKAQRTSSPR